MVYQFVSLPYTYPRFEIKLPPSGFFRKRINSISMESIPPGFVGPAQTIGGPPNTTVTSLSVPEKQKLTGPNPTSHNINLANQMLSSDLSTLCDEIIDLLTYQKKVNCSFPDELFNASVIFEFIFLLLKLFSKTKSHYSLNCLRCTMNFWRVQSFPTWKYH